MRRLFQFSTLDLLFGTVVAAGFAMLNRVEWDIGSGGEVLRKGWPKPYEIVPTIGWYFFSWPNLIKNIIAGLLLTLLAMLLFSKLRQWIKG